MRFLLMGNGGFYNHGCEAIARTTIDLIREKYKDADIVIATHMVDEDSKYITDDHVSFIPVKQQDLWKRFSIPWLLRQVFSRCSQALAKRYSFNPLWKAINASDVVLSIGGDNYSMDYGFPHEYLYLNALVKSSGKKLVIWGASIGPFENVEGIDTIINSLKAVDLITARETATIEYLAGIGVANNVKRVADPAFTLQPMIVPEMQHAISENTLGFNISPMFANCVAGGNLSILDSSAEFIAHILKTTEMDILCIPYVNSHNPDNNDHVFMGKLVDRFSGNKRVSLIGPQYNCMQLKYIISRCRYFIGARTHATIASLSSCVPTLSLGYSLKSRGINTDLFGSLDYTLNVHNFNAASLISYFNRLCAAEHKIREQLSKVIPEMKVLAQKNSEYISECLG